MSEYDPNKPETWPLVEIGGTPEIFINGFQGLMISDGHVKLTLFTCEIDVTGNPHRRVVGRLTMSGATATAIVQSLGQTIEQLRTQAGEQQAQRVN
jgi:hypothetical protein